MTTNELRKRFLDFFSANGHKLFPSDSLVPKNDPTVLFTSAGMNQFKRQFLGEVGDFRRACSCQKCLRTDDLDKVGKTPFHHTFFEMLGNFSFGDYFKEEAINLAWRFLLEELKLKEKDLWVSVYEDDEEAYGIWKEKIDIPQAKIVKLGAKENFWPSNAPQDGPNGPCGPCSEVFFDRGKQVGCQRRDCNVSCDCGRFVEIWNLVFTQFERKEKGVLEPLPSKNIDTGMGLERMASVLQGVSSNFEIDVFSPIVEAIKELIETKHPKSAAKQHPKGAAKQNQIYTIADHIRAIVFAISEGIMPSNESRGYVIRKLIRKATWQIMSLGKNKPILGHLVKPLAQSMQEPYPELMQRIEPISKIIHSEQENCLSILESSAALFEERFKDILEIKEKKIRAKDLRLPVISETGVIAFQLYDTYGIPLEITQSWAKEHGFQILIEEFNQALEEQKKRSKKGSVLKEGIFAEAEVPLKLGNTQFIGYSGFESKAFILGLVKDGKQLSSLREDDFATVVLDKTPFYAEAGGQTGDTGRLLKDSKLEGIFEVKDTKRQDGIILHLGKVSKGEFSLNDEVLACVDKERRLAIRRAHTSTHLLQASLRKLLGEHVQQSGSWVGQDRLRFDFTHFKGLNDLEKEKVEDLVNDFIRSNYRVRIDSLGYEEAKKKGALAFFAEKYDREVRVVSIEDISMELCAGTHLDYIGQIGLFLIINETALASGVRRIEAVCGKKAIEEVRERFIQYKEKLVEAQLENKNWQKECAKLKFRLVRFRVCEIIDRAKAIKGIQVIADEVKEANPELLRRATDLIKDSLIRKKKKGVILLGSIIENKVYLACSISSNLASLGLSAEEIVKRVARVIGGSGGGRRDFAQAGGKDINKLPLAFKETYEVVREQLTKSRKQIAK